VKNNLKKYLGFLAVATVIFLLGIYSGTSSKTLKTENQNRASMGETASLMIDYGDGTLEVYNDLPVLEETKVFDLLSLASENNFEIKTRDYGAGLGVFIDSINNIGPDPTGKKWWQYWVNNEYAKEGVSTRKVFPGDIIEFKFIEGQK